MRAARESASAHPTLVAPFGLALGPLRRDWLQRARALISGRANLFGHHEGFGFVPGGKDAESRLWLEDLRLDAAGTGAVATAIWYFQRTPSDEEVMRGPVTFVLSPTANGYRIQHANFGNY